MGTSGSLPSTPFILFADIGVIGDFKEPLECTERFELSLRWSDAGFPLEDDFLPKSPMVGG